MGGCLSVEVIAESAPSSPFGFSPRTPREAGDGSEAEGNGAGGGGVAGGGGKFRRGAGRGKRVGSGVGGAKAVSSGGGRGGGGEGGEGGWGRGAERQGGAVGRGNGRGGGGDGYGGGGNLAAPQSVPVEQTAGVPSDATSTNSAGLSATQSTSSDPKDGRGTARKFRLHELRAATSSFSKKAVLGRGSFGEVYLGKLGGKESKEVVEVAVKKLNPESSQGLDEWLAEIVLLRKLHHPNLVELIGYCAEKGEALLVYGLCPNGSLDDRLFPRREVDIIDWPTRVRIAQGAAQGLLHLHENKVIHRDLKPSNILLDQEMQARITDFGMAKQSASSVSHISTRVMGTMGYLDPEYMETGCLRDKSDVYSLGVILLQMLTGRDAVSKEGNVKLVDWMGPHLYPNITEPEAWIDPNLQGRFSRRGAKMLAAVAKQCSARHKEDRPEMSDVAQALMSVPLAD
ncbi:unnamed protein product [Closterium sp. NIES-54]